MCVDVEDVQRKREFLIKLAGKVSWLGFREGILGKSSAVKMPGLIEELLSDDRITRPKNKSSQSERRNLGFERYQPGPSHIRRIQSLE